MKKLIFIRHSRAEDQAPEITDFERSLTIKGKVISREMAVKLREKEADPGVFITSPAFRALETAFIFAAEFRIKHDNILTDSSLYHKSDIKHLLETLKRTGNDIDTLTIFGHNPAITEIPDRLSESGCEFMTKTSIVCLSFQVNSWSEIRPDSGKLEYFLKPEK